MTQSDFDFKQWQTELRGKLVVSCQALPGEPMYGSEIMARMALAAQMGGAAAIRANTPEDVRAIRAAVKLPIIGLYKVVIPGFDVYITPTLTHAIKIAEAGAEIISIDSAASFIRDRQDRGDNVGKPIPEDPRREAIVCQAPPRQRESVTTIVVSGRSS